MTPRGEASSLSWCSFTLQFFLPDIGPLSGGRKTSSSHPAGKVGLLWWDGGESLFVSAGSG